MTGLLNAAMNFVPSLTFWAWNKYATKEVGEVDPVAVCSLFALIPVMEERTRFGLYSGGKVIVQRKGTSVTIPVVEVEVSEQSVGRTLNADNRNEIRIFEDAIKRVNKEYGKNRMVQTLLRRTALGVRVYAKNYAEGDLAYGNLKSLAEILDESSKTFTPYHPIGLAGILQMDSKISDLRDRISTRMVACERENENPDELSLLEYKEVKNIHELLGEISKIVDGGDLKDENCPCEPDRLDHIVRSIEHIYERAIITKNIKPELESLLRYIDIFQDSVTDRIRQTPNLEVPT